MDLGVFMESDETSPGANWNAGATAASSPKKKNRVPVEFTQAVRDLPDCCRSIPISRSMQQYEVARFDQISSDEASMYVRPVGNNTYKECKWLVEEDAVVLMLLAAYHPGHSRQYYENETSTFHKTVAHNIWARPEFGFRGRRGPMAISVRIQSWLKSTRYAPGGKKGGGQPKDNRARRYLEMRGALGIDNASHTIHECEWDQSLVAFDAPRFKELIEFTMERYEANRTDSVGTEVGGGAEGVARATVGGPRQGASPSGQTSGGVGTGEAIGAGGFEAAGGVPRGGTQGNSAQGQMGDRASAPSMGPDLVYGSSSLDSNGLGGGEVGGGDEGVAPATVTARAPWIQMGLEEGRWEAEMRVWHQQRLVVLIKVHLEMGYPVAVTVLVEIYKEQQLVVLVKVHLKVGYPVAVLVLVEIYKEVSLEVVGGSLDPKKMSLKAKRERAQQRLVVLVKVHLEVGNPVAVMQEVAKVYKEVGLEPRGGFQRSSHQSTGGKPVSARLQVGSEEGRYGASVMMCF
ncbi:hypothetical protein CYMTET_29580 [Cymbomonas tetramitiformis]|uniref:Uncharacterized protein n=1 Tax=Cymbomonas tetramitiformis TaxID=36881 RepID=A0AAE0KV11_9CHLO|nr:hypothetical protein CYMTET_29580 [Cymbomonas tetramitiformis]